MPRTISAGLQTHLNSTLLTLAICVKISRTDGVVLGFTSSNKAFSFEGVAYEPAATIHSTQLRLSEGGGVDNVDVEGMLSSDRITDADLRAGRYDDALVELFAVNYEDLTLADAVMVAGTIGAVTFTDGAWRAELRSLFNRTRQQIGELTSHLCRVKKLGDARCQVSLATFAFAREVLSVQSANQITFGPDAAATGFYDYGEAEFRSGLNHAFAREVKSHTLTGGNAVITLQEPFPFTVSVGEVAVLTAGCDRTIATCISKFNNAINFQAEPHLPGVDKILRRGRR